MVPLCTLFQALLRLRDIWFQKRTPPNFATRITRGDRPALATDSRLRERSGTDRILLTNPKRLLQFPKFGPRGCWLSQHLSTFPSKNLLAPRFKLMRNIITNPEKILSRSDGWIFRRLDSPDVIFMISFMIIMIIIIRDMITFPPQ